MKITQHSDDLLVLDNTPWMLCTLMMVMILVSAYCVAVLPFSGQPLGFIALPFLIAGTALFKVLARRDQAYFDRRSGTLTLRHRTLTNYVSETIPLSDVSAAEVKVTRSKRRRCRRNMHGHRPQRAMKVVFCPAVRINGDVRPLTNLSTNGGRHQRNVDTLNAWLGMNPNPCTS